MINLCSSFAYAIDYWQYGTSGLETVVSKPKVTFRKFVSVKKAYIYGQKEECYTFKSKLLLFMNMLKATL